MQEEPNPKLLKLKGGQNILQNTVMAKRTYKYISKHHAEFRESDLKGQAVKRRDVVRWNFIGDLNQNMKLKRLVNMMRNMKRIKEFMFVTVPEKTTTDKEFAELSEAIKRQRGLQKIFMEFMFAASGYVNKNQINELAPGFQRVSRLKNIHISVDQYTFSDQGFNVLSESFKRLCALKRLSIEFKNTNKITDKGLEELGKNLKRVDSLRDIVVKCGSKRITNEGLQALGENLKRIKLLEHIWLSFKWQEMNGLGKLSEVLKGIRQLQKTTIDFSVPQYLYRGDDLIREHLCPGLQEFKSFKNLALKRLVLSGITDDGLRLFCETLEKLDFLQELGLALYYGSQITKKGIQILSETVKKFTCLKGLDLNINLCQSLTDDEISLLSGGFRELQSLESLNFYIREGFVVTNKGLKILTEALKQMKSLKTLHLVLDRFKEIDNEGIDLLTRDFQELVILKDVSLKFSECPKITNESLRILNRNLKQIPCLRYVRLHFMDCGQIGLEETLELRDSLKKKYTCKIRHSSDSMGRWAYP